MLASAIVKLTAVCNINCSYCYMFNLVDQTHTHVPARMELAIALKLLDRICDYVIPNSPVPFSIVLHGGEPTLWPESHFLRWLDQVQTRRDQGFNIDLALQGNLVRPLSMRLCSALREHNVSLGISVDGPKDLNDSVRMDHRGRGTYDRVMANVSSLIDSGNRDLIGGFLSVGNPAIAPSQYFAWMQSLPITKVDVLWPIQYNWNNTPWGMITHREYATKPQYGAWFAGLFDLWWQSDNPDLQIRLFNNLVNLALGSHEHIDMLVNDTMNMFVVNTDGTYEYPDYLRNAADGSARTELGVYTHSLRELASIEGFAKLLKLSDHLPESCESCRHRDVCGGGFLPGRADAQQIITRRESVLCDDQKFFFDVVMGQIHTTIAERNLREHDRIVSGQAAIA